MKILDLVLKNKWYQMIALGEKTEEYRDITPYWFRRLIDYDPELYDGGDPILLYFQKDTDASLAIRWDLNASSVLSFKDYTHVRFRRGYTNTTMTLPIKNITIGMGNPAWGAPADCDVFIIKLGERI